jgi:hypothetical protein
MPAGPSAGPRRTLVAVGLLAGLGALVVAAMVFQPWKLFVDDVVDEAFPVATTESSPPAPGGSAGTAPVTSPPIEPVAVAVGSFVSLDHPTEGLAGVYALADGSRIVRLEAFRTDNGPDLFVYLSAAGVGGDPGGGINLGSLKGNVGAQNYEVPAGVDLTEYDTVVIWCRQFNSSFGAAALNDADATPVTPTGGPASGS